MLTFRQLKSLGTDQIKTKSDQNPGLQTTELIETIKIERLQRRNGNESERKTPSSPRTHRSIKTAAM